jgi:TonB family protein
MRRLLLAALLAALPAAAFAQDDAPKVAGGDVPVPKRVRFVAPAYPAEAQAQGRRGIVILELVLDVEGRVESASVVRSVPGFDEAALAAARQWTYEPTRVEGRPVRVRLTVPITFALRLPETTRDPGVPQMVQGGVPGFPAGASGPARVVAEVTLHTDGSVAEASVKSGESPYAEALLQALRTWRFVPDPEPSRIVFDVEADFVRAGQPGQPPRVDLKLTSPRRSAVADEMPATPAPAVSPSPAPADAAATSAAPAATPAPAAEAAAPPADGPPVEVIPPPAQPPTPVTPTPAPQPGFSAVRDVTLGLGVPDLASGRRPVVPPVARIARAGGTIEAQFSVDAGGATQVQKVEGPELLREAARQTVQSWTFRRTSAERVFLVATLSYEGDAAKAEVRRAE